MDGQWVGYLVTTLWTLLNLGIVVGIVIFLRCLYKYMMFKMDTSTPHGTDRKS